jgi:hypothetical protein
MAQRLIVFDAQSLLQLLTHYSDGKDLPLDGELQAAGVNRLLDRMVGLVVRSKEWTEDSPLTVRYEGKKILTWTQDPGGPGPEWREAQTKDS